MIKLTEESLKFLKPQRSFFEGMTDLGLIENVYNETLNDYIKIILKHLPPIKTVVDIGGGIGGLAILLTKMYGCKVYILEKEGFEHNKRTGGYDSVDSFAAYNTRQITQAVWINSGLKKSDLNYINVDEPFEYPECDLTVSTLSWGFHYPLKTYWDLAFKNSKFIVTDCRNDNNKPDDGKIIRKSSKYDTVLWDVDLIKSNIKDSCDDCKYKTDIPAITEWCSLFNDELQGCKLKRCRCIK